PMTDGTACLSSALGSPSRPTPDDHQPATPVLVSIAARASMRPAVVLWDFGDTLVDERWMRRNPPSCARWESVWLEAMVQIADAWNMASLSGADEFEAIAARSGLSVGEVEQHAIGCCQQVAFHRIAWAVASERRWPQAIVTVNPDLLEDYVVPAYGLDTVFD